MYVLIFVLFNGTAQAEVVSYHPTMFRCFQAREVLSKTVGKGGGHYNDGTQALCLKIPAEST